MIRHALGTEPTTRCSYLAKLAPIDTSGLLLKRHARDGSALPGTEFGAPHPRARTGRLVRLSECTDARTESTRMDAAGRTPRRDGGTVAHALPHSDLTR